MIIKPGDLNDIYKCRFSSTETWVAYIDPKTNRGVGVYSPQSNKFNAYRVGPDVGQSGSKPESDTSYVALIATYAIKPSLETSFDAYLAVGTVDEIRQKFTQLSSTVQKQK
jgi:hypothetical protein